MNHGPAVGRVVRELIRHTPAPNRAMSFLFWNRTRRELALAPYTMSQCDTVFSPYLDHDVFDALMGLSPSVTADHQLHTEAILRAYPHVRHIPFEGGSSCEAPHMFHRRTALDLARRVFSSPGPVRRGYMLPRIALAALTGRVRYLWFLPLAVYLGQFDEAIARETYAA